MSWNDLTGWWLEELAKDDAYESVVTPLLLDVLQPEPGSTYLDLGSGEGRVLRALEARGATAYGVEMNHRLAAGAGPKSLVAELPSIPISNDSVDGVYTVLVLEHLVDHSAFFKEAARVTRAGGVLALVANHPIWTAPDSSPITDTDGEVLWRPGEYFSDGSSEVKAGEGTVTFHHRTMGALFNAAASAGWSLQHTIEQPHHEFEDQAGIPRLLACRWRREGRSTARLGM